MLRVCPQNRLKQVYMLYSPESMKELDFVAERYARKFSETADTPLQGADTSTQSPGFSRLSPVSVNCPLGPRETHCGRRCWRL